MISIKSDMLQTKSELIWTEGYDVINVCLRHLFKYINIACLFITFFHKTEDLTQFQFS